MTLTIFVFKKEKKKNDKTLISNKMLLFLQTIMVSNVPGNEYRDSSVDQTCKFKATINCNHFVFVDNPLSI